MPTVPTKDKKTTSVHNRQGKVIYWVTAVFLPLVAGLFACTGLVWIISGGFGVGGIAAGGATGGMATGGIVASSMNQALSSGNLAALFKIAPESQLYFNFAVVVLLTALAWQFFSWALFNFQRDKVLKKKGGASEGIDEYGRIPGTDNVMIRKASFFKDSIVKILWVGYLSFLPWVSHQLAWGGSPFITGAVFFIFPMLLILGVTLYHFSGSPFILFCSLRDYVLSPQVKGFIFVLVVIGALIFCRVFSDAFYFLDYPGFWMYFLPSLALFLVIAAGVYVQARKYLVLCGKVEEKTGKKLADGVIKGQDSFKQKFCNFIRSLRVAIYGLAFQLFSSISFLFMWFLRPFAGYNGLRTLVKPLFSVDRSSAFCHTHTMFNPAIIRGGWNGETYAAISDEANDERLFNFDKTLFGFLRVLGDKKYKQFGVYFNGGFSWSKFENSKYSVIRNVGRKNRIKSIIFLFFAVILFIPFIVDCLWSGATLTYNWTQLAFVLSLVALIVGVCLLGRDYCELWGTENSFTILNRLASRRVGLEEGKRQDMNVTDKKSLEHLQIAFEKVHGSCA